MPTTFASCTPQNPLMSFDGSGTASVLKYSLPVSTSFDIHGYAELKIDSAGFKTGTTVAPDGNFWELTAGKTRDEIRQMLNDDLLGASTSNLIVNNHIAQTTNVVVPVNRPGANMVSQAPKVGSPRPGASFTPKVGEPRGGNGLLPAPTSLLENDDDLLAGVPVQEVITQIMHGNRPVITRSLYGDPVLQFIPKPKSVEPGIYIALHYKVVSFLGDYGAGKTVKTFSLLPGEKTTISVTTFKHFEETKSRAESVIDSFSRSSADNFQSTLENQSAWDSSTTKAKTTSVGGSIGANIPVTKSAKLNIGANTSHTKSLTSTVSSHVGTVSTAMNQHSEQASNNREVSVNTEVSTKEINEVTETTIREIKNINLSRTLNFVFRQALQEYVTITYLDQVTIIYTNGYPESRREVTLSEMDDLLLDVLKEGGGDTYASDVRKDITRQLCNIFDYTGVRTAFAECITDTEVDCCSTGSTYTHDYIRKKAGLTQTYSGHSVPGIILDVQSRILRTDSVLVDSLLGQGEALDCYNNKLQDIATQKAQSEADILKEKALQQLELTKQVQGLTEMGDPTLSAPLYSKLIPLCCDTPQNCCCGNDGTAEPSRT